MKSVLKFAIAPAILWAVMIGFASLDSIFNWRGTPEPLAGWLLIAAGAALAVWCAGLFRTIGHGTPNPFVLKTQRMVIAGPYRYVRNPMMWAFGMIISGAALALGSLGLWIGLWHFAIFALLFVPLYEERDMLRRFGDEYRRYCRHVPRWIPRLRGYQGIASAAKR